jgi:phosphatidylinositol dimannoside acyltransferase
VSGEPVRHRLRTGSVMWRHVLAWGVNNVSYALEPMQMWVWTFFFFVFWGSGRRTVMRNLARILPGSTAIGNFFRAYRVFLEFAWTFTDSAQFLERQIGFDWEFEGAEHLQALSSTSTGGIVLTAHMGNYDLGSYMFSRHLNRTITTIRAPEVDPASHAYSAAQRERLGGRFRVLYNTDPTSLAYQLVEAIGEGQIVAIQGDRALPGVPARCVTLFGARTKLPVGPFALAMATGVSIQPTFIARVGRRRYRVIAAPPIGCSRKPGMSRDDAIAAAMDEWTRTLERVVARHWYQWFAFEPFEAAEESAHA